MFLALFVACSEPAPVPADGPDILLVTVCSWRAERVGAYGYAQASGCPLRSAGVRAIATRRATGVPSLAITTSSPASAATRSWDSLVLASCTLTVIR